MATSLFSRRGKKSPRPRRAIPRLETFEERAVPATLTVTNALDSGAGSLRQAVLDANDAAGPDAIVFHPSVKKITLTSGELLITDDLYINGPSAKKLLISGNDSSRIFNIQGVNVTIDDVILTKGLADGDSPVMAGTGGAILNQAGSSLTLQSVILTKNRAVGDADATTTATPVFVLKGAGIGGAVANFGDLEVLDSVFTSNAAVGANETAGGTFGVDANFAGIADGGAIINFGTASVTESKFTFNSVRAGNDGTGTFAAIGGGGAIGNDGVLSVSYSAFIKNQAVGGNDSTSPNHNGHALGGAIKSGSLAPLAAGPSASLEVTRSTFQLNRAIGGNNNTVTDENVPAGDGPNNGYGGAILVYQGTASISHSQIQKNRAVGGNGGGENASLGVGGGIHFFNFLGGVTASISHSVIALNEAVGGNGAIGARGGDGLGGGVAIGGLGAPFGAPGTLTMSQTVLFGNKARGGAGGAGANGGHGHGGGLYIGADSTANLDWCGILRNMAIGGKGKGGGISGEGIGGGIFNLGTLNAADTTIVLNKSTTSDPNQHG
jgi:hypothetical protein